MNYGGGGDGFVRVPKERRRVGFLRGRDFDSEPAVAGQGRPATVHMSTTAGVKLVFACDDPMRTRLAR